MFPNTLIESLIPSSEYMKTDKNNISYHNNEQENYREKCMVRRKWNVFYEERQWA